ncbi:MAG: pyridoxamine 5'-phosphate oxidase family protein [Bacteroidota bacterium]
MRTRFIGDTEEIAEVINKCQVCHMSMVGPDHEPYVLPMNFGYHEGVVYLHSSKHGKKIDILQQNPRVVLAFSCDYFLRYQNEGVACSYSMKYRSILIYGKAEFIDDPDAKKEVMNVIMRQYTGKDFSFNMPAIREVCVYKVVPEKITGRAYGL